MLVDIMHLNLFVLQTFGWNPQEAKLHMVNDYFSQSEVMSFSNPKKEKKKKTRLIFIGFHIYSEK